MDWPDGRPRYREGQRWRLKDGKKRTCRFDFVITDEGAGRDNQKGCRLECVKAPDGEIECKRRRCPGGIEQPYSHDHLREYGRLIYDPEYGDLREGPRRQCEGSVR